MHVPVSNVFILFKLSSVSFKAVFPISDEVQTTVLPSNIIEKSLARFSLIFKALEVFVNPGRKIGWVVCEIFTVWML